MKMTPAVLTLFPQLSYADQVANNAAMIDNFPQRMERFLECVCQVYIQESVDSHDKELGKKLVHDYQAQMSSKKTQLEKYSPENDMPGVDN